MIDHIDHVGITTIDAEKCADFYTRVLGMTFESFESGGITRRALKFSSQKINIHVRGKEFEPKAHLAVSGSLDLCFIASIPLNSVIAKLNDCQWPIIEGPGLRTGANGKIRSVYVRDPDLNLVGVSEYLTVIMYLMQKIN
jgi:catechol 2,3-dioxygenase-like lactoylglutathione lyase family enzyme